MSSVTIIGSQILKPRCGVVGIAVVKTSNYSTDPQTYNLSALKRGTGGRSSFNGIVATVFGSTGFTGRYVVNRLGKIGTQMILPYRGDTLDILRLRVSGDLGQIFFTPYNLKDEDSIRKAVKYSNVVVNLVGRDWETRNFKFNDVHVEGARRLARIARECGVDRFIHISSLNASDHPEGHVLPKGSEFLRSKFEGEIAVLEEFPDATIFRPSDIYGQEDRFLRYFIHGLRRTDEFMPVWKKGEATIKQPCYIGDFAAGVVAAVRDPDTKGKIYQAVGPRRYYLSELLDWFFRVMRTEKFVRYPLEYDPLFSLRVKFFEFVRLNYPVANLHWDRIERECVTDDVKRDLPTLEDLGVTLTPMEDQIAYELRPWTHGIYHGVDADEPTPRAEPPKVVV
ncbi:NADH dehydrogenase [ubiquinone] 1 alpha subcomplex subunit 9, mitochondrial [Coccinella septempunctata]|uniref:NADH dehydrogenase [ubiquinone] 1 alpha subcomplex subunit 9, mitochondrial n=1 Tax=Coccinella septempunctata TaxID=41139 RepID=UPI001D097B00|nr:NADH dehydrogenase [ubiquinone] 1 alpha subcomplex subunit 9, mitochondrial [Coccinella septempunctata]